MINEDKCTRIEIHAVDTLFFRDARPFTMGDETWANGMFPPSPSVFYGALRGTYFGHYPDTFKTVGTDADPTGSLRIKGIYLKRSDDLFLPLPYDLVKKKTLNHEEKQLEIRKKIYTVYPLTLKEKTTLGLMSSSPTDWLLRFHTNEVVENLSDGVLKKSLFQEYLNEGSTSFDARRLADWIEKEPKIGIARDNVTRSSQEGALYRVDMRRLETWETPRGVMSFTVDFTGLEQFPDEGLIRLGGEGKAGYYKKVNIDETIEAPEITSACFKLYLATPAVFANGWLPKWINKQEHDGKIEYEGIYHGLHLTLLTAAIGRYQPIGGFDIEKKMPKPLQRTVPAGSVYYFRLEKGSMQDILRYFHNKPISDEEEYRIQGFGLSYIGALQQPSKLTT